MWLLRVGFPWPNSWLQHVMELLAAMYLVDLISGILHVTLDYCDCGPALRSITAKSKEDVHRVRRFDPRFAKSGAWHQAVWNFQVHHHAPFPEHDDQFTETALLATPALLATLAQRALGWIDPCGCRVWVTTLLLGHFVQWSHFLAHRRVHLGRGSLPPLVARLQDMRLLLHPDVHRRHHSTFDNNFCIFNGWANPLLNAGFRVAKAIGWADASLALVQPE